MDMILVKGIFKIVFLNFSKQMLLVHIGIASRGNSNVSLQHMSIQ